MSKILANRLKKVIVSPSQSVFLPGSLISDNVIVTYETLHTMNCHLHGKEGYMVTKLDMSKTYDKIEWRFLKMIMEKMDLV